MKKNAYLKIVFDFFMAILMLLLLIFVIPKLAVCFMPFVIGWIISLIANPIVKFLEKRIKIVRKHGSAIFIVFVIGLIIGLLYLAGYFIYEQATSIANDVPMFYENLETQFDDMMVRYEKVYKKLPSFVQGYLDDFRERLTSKQSMMEENTTSVDMASRAVKNVASAILSFIFTVLAAYFFTADREIILDGAKKILPSTVVKNCKLISDNFKSAVGGYFKAQFKIMFVLVIIMYIAFKIFGIKYALLIALFVGFLDLLPVFGTGAVLWPWTLYYVMIRNYYIAVGMIVLYAVCQFVKQFLQPKMVGDSVGLNPLTTLFLLFIGYKIGGIVGILIAIPVGMIVINLYKAGAFDIWVEDVCFIIKQFDRFKNTSSEYIKNEIQVEKQEDNIK